MQLSLMLSLGRGLSAPEREAKVYLLSCRSGFCGISPYSNLT